MVKNSTLTLIICVCVWWKKKQIDFTARSHFTCYLFRC